jgi:hypothetical protein
MLLQLYGPNIHTRESACASAKFLPKSLNYVLGFIHFLLLSPPLGLSWCCGARACRIFAIRRDRTQRPRLCRLPQQRPSWTRQHNPVPAHAGGSSQAAATTYAAPTTLQQAPTPGQQAWRRRSTCSPTPLISPGFSSMVVSYVPFRH